MTKAFWNKEYSDPKHLTMSSEPSSDLQTFEKWGVRNAEWHPFPKDGLVLDIGCGNGRNLKYICEKYSMNGYGLDISGSAIDQAKGHGYNENTAKIKYAVMSAEEPLTMIEDESVDVVLDMMTSHMLRSASREKLLQEILRITKPYAWLFFKTFVLDGDMHAKRMIAENPDRGNPSTHEAPEENSYIHPRIGVFEHVWTEGEIHDFFGPYFKIHKMIKSYKHFKDGKPYKRRTVSVYMERMPDRD